VVCVVPDWSAAAGEVSMSSITRLLAATAVFHFPSSPRRQFTATLDRRPFELKR